MKLQLHGVVQISVKPIKEFTKENGLAKYSDFKTRQIVIEDEKGQKFEIDLFSESDLELTYE